MVLRRKQNCVFPLAPIAKEIHNLQHFYDFTKEERKYQDIDYVGQKRD